MNRSPAIDPPPGLPTHPGCCGWAEERLDCKPETRPGARRVQQFSQFEAEVPCRD
jgi:hypothetical protein